MSNIDDETVRAKMRKLRVSTFADVFYEIVTTRPTRMRYQRTSSSPRSKRPTHNGNNATSPKSSPRHNSDTRTPAWLKLPRQSNAASTCAN